MSRDADDIREGDEITLRVKVIGVSVDKERVFVGWPGLGSCDLYSGFVEATRINAPQDTARSAEDEALANRLSHIAPDVSAEIGKRFGQDIGRVVLWKVRDAVEAATADDLASAPAPTRTDDTLARLVGLLEEAKPYVGMWSRPGIGHNSEKLCSTIDAALAELRAGEDRR